LLVVKPAAFGADVERRESRDVSAEVPIGALVVSAYNLRFGPIVELAAGTQVIASTCCLH
jgi:hypothetical protein